MKKYSLTDEEARILGRMETAVRTANIQGAAVQKEITSYVVNKVLPRLGIKHVKGTAVPMSLKPEKKVIEVGVAIPDKKIIIPKGVRNNGEQKIRKK